MTHPTFVLQPLEPRRFLSATPAAVEDCPEVIEAKEAVHDAATAFRLARYAGRQELAALRTEIGEEIRKLHEEKGDEVRAALVPLQQQLRAAIRAQGEARRQILEQLQGIREKWQPTIAADLKAIHDARAAGDADALAEAIETFHGHRNALYGELNVLKEDLKEVTEETGAAISAAKIAIEDKLAEFSPALKEAFDKFRTRQREIGERLQARRADVVEAHQQLADAVQECREEHGGVHA